MADKMRIPFDELSQYQGKLQTCVVELEATVAQAKKIAAACQEGALIGGAGEEAVRALTEQFNPAVLRLKDKTTEEISDIQAYVKEQWQMLEAQIQSTMG